MAKNKPNKKNYLSIFFEEAKTSAPKISPVFKARILKDAHKTWGGGDAIQDSPKLDATLVCLKELSGLPSVLGSGASLAVGFYIGLWNCSNRYKEQMTRLNRSSFWGIVVQIMCVLSAIGMLQIFKDII